MDPKFPDEDNWLVSLYCFVFGVFFIVGVIAMIASGS